MDLKTLQTNFVCSLIEKQNDEVLSQWITARNPRRAVDCINTYRQSRIGRITKVLKNTFPVCYALVGEHYFKQLCFHYMNSNFCNSHDVTIYGSNFSQFLTNTIDKHQLDYLPSMAEFEWAYFNVLYQGKMLALDVNALANIPIENQGVLKFRQGASHHLFDSDFPIWEIWHAHQHGLEFEPINLNMGGCQLLIFRREWEIVIEALSPLEFLFLSCVSQGMTFEQIGHMELTALFPKAVERGWINDFYL